MHYHQTLPNQQSQQNSTSPDLFPINELKMKFRQLDPYTTEEINVLLLENISMEAVKTFQEAGFNVNVLFARLFRIFVCLLRIFRLK